MNRGTGRLRRARVVATSVCVVSLLALGLVALDGEYQDGLARVSADAARPVVLDVALVNEDRGVGSGDDQVNLGRGYVTQVASDTTAAWHVLSRGVAERGLAAGSFQLLVVIPGDFSQKLLDLESVDPTPVAVTYQVNGQGNSRVEELAGQRGREIVAQLNGQLVDMYLASILGNLRQAQDGVRVVVDAETRNVQAFAKDLDPAARSLGDRLEVLATGTDGSVDANETLVAGLQRLGVDQQTSVLDLGEHDVSLADLVAAREAGTLTHAAFMEALLGMDAHLLSGEVQALYDGLAGTGASLVDQLDAASPQPNHAAAVATLRALVDEAGASAAGRVSALAALEEPGVLDAYSGDVQRALGWSGDGPITLATLLRLAVERETAVGGPDPTRPSDLRGLLVEIARRQIAALPYRDPDELRTAIDGGVFGHAGAEVEALLDEAPADLLEVREWDGYAEVPGTPEAPGEIAGGDVDALVADLLAARARVPRPEAPTEPEVPVDPENPGTPTEPSEPGEPGEPGEPAEPGEPEPPVEPSPPGDPGDPATPAEPGDPGTPVDPAEPGTPVEPGEQVDAEQAIDELVTTAGRYGTRVRQIADAYRRSAELVRLVASCEQSCGLHPDTDVSAAVEAVLWRSVQRQVAAEEQHLAAVTALDGRLDAATVELDSTAGGLLRTTRQLAGDITAQLDEVGAMRAAMRGVLDREAVAARSVAESDAQTRAIVAEARTLTAASQVLATSTEAGTDTARRVTELLTGLRGDVAGLLDESAALRDSSTSMTRAFTGQVAEAGVFADSFGGVLPNAHSAGVLNERLLQFLVDPVAPGQREPVSSTDVTRPFPWVLITFALSLSAAYVLAGLGASERREASVFDRRDDGWLRADVRGLGTASLAGVLLGAGLVWASATSLEVARERQPLWAATVILAALGQTLLARWLVVQLRAVGLGLCVALLVGYVFVSDAVGTGVTSGFSGVVAALDPLHHAETVMTRVLSPEGAGPDALAPLIVLVLGAVVATLLMGRDLRRLLPRRLREVIA